MKARDLVSVALCVVFSAIPCVAQGAWTITNVDLEGDTGYYTSIALDSADYAHISYYDDTSGSLKYATNASGTWVITTVDSVVLSEHANEGNSIALDSADKVHISYHDGVNEVLKYATNASGAWVTATVDADRDSGYHNSIAVDSADNVHICHSKSPSMLAYVTNATGSWVTTIIGPGAPVNPSIALDASDNAHISYCGDVPVVDYGTLNYATNASGSWVTSILDSTSWVWDSYIATDSMGYVHIVITIVRLSVLNIPPTHPVPGYSKRFTLSGTSARNTPSPWTAWTMPISASRIRTISVSTTRPMRRAPG